MGATLLDATPPISYCGDSNRWLQRENSFCRSIFLRIGHNEQSYASSFGQEAPEARSMGMHYLSQWIRQLAVASALGGAVLSCGSGASSQFTVNAKSIDASLSGSGGDGAPEPAYDGSLLTLGDDGGGCAAQTCSALGFNCGKNSDGCGGILDCGSCPSGQVCGGGGYSVCGVGGGSDAGSAGDGGAVSCTT